MPRHVDDILEEILSELRSIRAAQQSESWLTEDDQAALTAIVEESKKLAGVFAPVVFRPQTGEPMSVTSELATVTANLQTAATGVTAQAAQIAALQSQIAAGGSTLTPTDQAALDALVASSAQLDAQLTPPTPTPAP